MTQNILLKASSLSRTYGSQQVVHDLSFTLHKGEVLGFLGPNGAGKSTTMKMLSGNLAPTQGEITINGFDLLTQPKQAKAHIGYLPEQPPLYKELTVIEFLKFSANIHNIPRAQQQSSIDTVIEQCGLTEVTRRLIGHLSKGYQQRVGIAQAIIHSPAVVILDEPTSGLDPVQIRDIRHLIREIAIEHSVILSTHILPEVDMLCDRVQIINHGQLVLNESLDGFHKHMQSSSLQVSFQAPPALSALRNISGVEDIEQLDPHQFILHYHPDNNPTTAIVNLSVTQSWQLQQLTPQSHSLEEVFMSIIQQEEKH